jgi:hypothetical protein
MSSKPIDSKLPQDTWSTTGQLKCLPVDQADEDSTNDECARLFSVAAGTYGTGKEVAFALRVDPSFVTHLRAGSKGVALRHVLPLLRKKESALAFINSLCDIAGVAHAKPKRTVTKRDAERQLTLELRRLAPVFELLRREAASKLGTDENGIDEALDEVTAEHRFAK